MSDLDERDERIAELEIKVDELEHVDHTWTAHREIKEDLSPSLPVPRRVAEIRRRLSGRVELVLGNHDRSREFYLRAGFDAVYRTASVSVPLLSGESVQVELAHHPVLAPAGMALCGHVHEKWRRRGSVVNVGVDQWDFRPVSIDELLACPEE